MFLFLSLSLSFIYQLLQKVQDDITSLFALSSKTTFIGRSGGDLLILHGNDPPCTLPLALCTKGHGGEVTFVRYVPQHKLLLYCYSKDHVHVLRGSIENMRSHTWVHCYDLTQISTQTTCHQLVLNNNNIEEESLDLWVGSSKSIIEVWSFSLNSAHSDKLERVVHPVVTLQRSSLSPYSFVSQMVLNPDGTVMFVFIEDKYRRGNGCLFEVGVVDRLPRRYWQCAIDGKSY